MNETLRTQYDAIRSGTPGFLPFERGLIEVRGGEAVQFLDGLLSNDVKTLADGEQMLAAFPNAQGRLLAVVRVIKRSQSFLIETEKATHQKVFDNLFRFTFAGDFLVEDLSDRYQFVIVVGHDFAEPNSNVIKFVSTLSRDYFVPRADAESFYSELYKVGGIRLAPEVFEVVRIESGLPLYGKDMDETTVVPELALDGLISYKKGCYIGQEIIARIHFRGHVAKQLVGIKFDGDQLSDVLPPRLDGRGELLDGEGKNAGYITSTVYSPSLGCVIGLAFVRHAHLAAGTRLNADGRSAEVATLPFV